jgi:hypothetical protein
MCLPSAKSLTIAFALLMGTAKLVPSLVFHSGIENERKLRKTAVYLLITE